MSTTWCRRSSRCWTTQSSGSGNALPSTLSSVASTSSSPAHGSRSGSRTMCVAPRSGPTRLAARWQHGARRQPLGVVAQAGVDDAAAAAREVHGDSPAVELGGRRCGSARRAPPAARRRPAAPGRTTAGPDLDAAVVPERAPPEGAQAFGELRGGRERDVGVLAAVDDELQELVERRAEVGVDVVAQVDARGERGLGRAAQRLAAHGAAGVAVAPRAARRWPPWRWRRAPTRPCESAGAAAWPA